MLQREDGLRSLVVLTVALLAACGGGTEPPPTSVATSLTLVSGDDQQAGQDSVLAAAIIVQVNDQAGAAMVSVSVGFTAQQGTALSASANTGTDGRASTRWRLGTQLGEQRLRVEVSGSSVEALIVSALAHDVVGPGVAPDALPAATNELALQVSGTTVPPEPGATIQITGGQGGGSATTDAQGRFTTTVTLNANQINALAITATDTAGNAGATVQRAVEHDDIGPPAPIVDPVPTFTNLNPYTLSGMGQIGTTITVTGGAAPATYSGFIQIFLPQVQLNPNVLNTLTVTATDSAGNVSPPVVVTLTHDGIAPSQTVVSPTPASFDTDGDLRVNVRVDYSDNGSGIETTSFSVTNSRAIGGGAVAGGANALQELRPQFTTVTGSSAETNFTKEFEFPGGANTLTLRIADRAGNVRTDNGLGGVQMPGTRRLSPSFLPADTANLVPFFTTLAAGGTWTVPDSASLSGGTHILRAFVRDRAGNIGTASITVTVPTPTASVFLPDTTVSGIGTEFDVTLSAGQLTDLFGADGRLTYDPAILEVVQIVTTGFTGNMSTAFNATTPGTIRFALASASPLSAGGGLVRVRFRTRALGTSGIQIADLSFNEGGLGRTVLNGQVVVQ